MKPEIQIDKREFYRTMARLALPIALQNLMLASVAAHVASGHSFGTCGRVRPELVSAYSLCLYLPGRGGEDSLGFIPFPEI